TLSEIVENIMQLILKIPDMVDASLNQIRNQIAQVNAQVTGLAGRVQAFESGGAGPSASGKGSGGAGSPARPPPPPGVPGAPPPPPGAPRPPGAPAAAATDNPVSLRSSIMGELKALFAKRKSLSE
ncbi:MAG TPA: hypothetical protein VKK79_19820, partial [Candidatus Lokiarchaeia archaeon]|nr:hypothetical protein [Candidatus Lokiarchaeia archaeon]